MRILLAHNRYRYHGGEDAVFQNEVWLLRRAGHEVVEYTEDNCGIDERSALRLGLRAIWSEASRKRLASVIRKAAPNVVHFHNTFPLISPSAYSACKAARVPVVQTLHNYRLLCPAATLFRDGHLCEECSEHGLWRSVNHACYRGSRKATLAVAAMLGVHRLRKTWSENVDCFITLTNFSRKKFIDAGLPEEKLVVKSNFLLEEPGANAKYGTSALFVGRLAPEKGVKTLLAAWSKLKIESRLWIVGEGPARAGLDQYQHAKGLVNVHFTGALSWEAVLDRMREARFLVFPSEWYEGFPMTIVEAFACGVPVISSRLGAMAEIVDDGRTGLHFNPGDADDLAAKVEWAWNHPDEMARMGCAARAEYESKYTAERNYEQLMVIYESVLGSKSQRSSSTLLSSRAGLENVGAAQ